MAPGGGSAGTGAVIDILGALIGFAGVFCYELIVARANKGVALDYKDFRAKRLKK